jgi:hypothetical protein
MAQAVAKCLFAALLAMLSAQAVVPRTRVSTHIEAVGRTETQQQLPRAVTSARSKLRLQSPTPAYTSRAQAAPDIAILFQRPPPASFLVA